MEKKGLLSTNTKISGKYETHDTMNEISKFKYCLLMAEQTCKFSDFFAKFHLSQLYVFPPGGLSQVASTSFDILFIHIEREGEGRVERE